MSPIVNNSYLNGIGSLTISGTCSLISHGIVTSTHELFAIILKHPIVSEEVDDKIAYLNEPPARLLVEYLEVCFRNGVGSRHDRFLSGINRIWCSICLGIRPECTIDGYRMGAVDVERSQGSTGFEKNF